jgi:LPS sulfotransferase NodH
MIVNRRTFIVKRGRLEEVVALIMAETKRVGQTPVVRLYLPEIAAFDQIAMEWEFENLAEYQRFWEEWFASPQGVAFLEKWNDLTETGGANEIWTLAE